MKFCLLWTVMFCVLNLFSLYLIPSLSSTGSPFEQCCFWVWGIVNHLHLCGLFLSHCPDPLLCCCCCYSVDALTLVACDAFIFEILKLLMLEYLYCWPSKQADKMPTSMNGHWRAKDDGHWESWDRFIQGCTRSCWFHLCLETLVSEAMHVFENYREAAVFLSPNQKQTNKQNAWMKQLWVRKVCWEWDGVTKLLLRQGYIKVGRKKSANTSFRGASEHQATSI